MSTTNNTEATTRPNFGEAVEVIPGSRLVTVTRPDGSQTVVQEPVGKPKPKPNN
jgi:hypothetical protein